ncbi:MAG TPA: biopolymer transporter ExbD [Myxococcales bacterium]
MAGGMDLGTKKGGKKSLDAPINLVPFIDLMAVTISFLIMTAVWNQVGRLPVTQAGGVPKDGEAPKDALSITLVVTERGYTLTVGGGAARELPKVLCTSGKTDRIGPSCEESSLVATLRKLKAEAPQQRAISVQVDDGVRTADLIRVLDACNLKDSTGQPELFPDIAVGGTS